MLIYNVTTKVDAEAVSEWLGWMHQTHIPEMMATGKFLECRFCRVLDGEAGGDATFAAQYLCPDEASLADYQRNHAPALRADVLNRFGDRCVSFRTILELTGTF
jgi:hypothetical protein